MVASRIVGFPLCSVYRILGHSRSLVFVPTDKLIPRPVGHARSKPRCGVILSNGLHHIGEHLSVASVFIRNGKVVDLLPAGLVCRIACHGFCNCGLPANELISLSLRCAVEDRSRATVLDIARCLVSENLYAVYAVVVSHSMGCLLEGEGQRLAIITKRAIHSLWLIALDFYGKRHLDFGLNSVVARLDNDNVAISYKFAVLDRRNIVPCRLSGTRDCGAHDALLADFLARCRINILYDERILRLLRANLNADNSMATVRIQRNSEIRGVRHLVAQARICGSAGPLLPVNIAVSNALNFPLSIVDPNLKRADGKCGTVVSRRMRTHRLLVGSVNLIVNVIGAALTHIRPI